MLPLLVVLAAFSPVSARELVTVTMTAPSEPEAIRYALSEALGRAGGGHAGSESGSLHPELAEAKRRIESEFDPSSSDPHAIRASSAGYIRGYTLAKSTPTEAGVTVEIEANVLTFDPNNPRPGARQTVVVESFSMAPGALQLDQPAVGAEVFLAGLRDDLETTLVRSQKFSVLTRKNLAGVLKEQAFIAGDTVHHAEAIKLHQMLGGDYVVSGRINRLYVHTRSSVVKLTGHVNRSKAADVAMTITLYNVATGAVEWTAPYSQEYTWSGADLAADPSFDDDGLVARTMVLEAADALAKQLIRRVFPLRVIEADMQARGGAVFYLNAGSGVIAIGDRFELIQLGKELRDPDSGELLGHRERLVGLVHIVRQDEKLSQAEWIDPESVDKAFFADGSFDPAQLACRPL